MLNYHIHMVTLSHSRAEKELFYRQVLFVNYLPEDLAKYEEFGIPSFQPCQMCTNSYSDIIHPTW